MDNLNYWPYTNIHELNLDWIIEKVKELDLKVDQDIEQYVQAYIDEHFEEWTVNANYDPNTETIVYTNGTSAVMPGGDVLRFAIDNVFVAIKDQTARDAIDAADNEITNIQGDITTMQGNITAIQSDLNKLDHIYDVGSVICLASASDPGLKYGGRWVLEDMEFADKGMTNYISAATVEDSNVSSFNIYAAHQGHTISFEIQFTNAVQITDNAFTLADIDLTQLGISALMDTVYTSQISDGGNAFLSYKFSTNGHLELNDAFQYDTGTDKLRHFVAANTSTTYHTFSVTVKHQLMDPAWCDRFYYKRVS